MKKLVGGHKIKFYILLVIFLVFSKNIYSSQIYDFQTDKFIEKINSQILSVNNYDKKINFRIIHDNFPNAFVTEQNILFLSSGLIIHSPDYVSLLAVLAHEIGHLENYHVKQRRNEIDSLQKINSLGSFAAIAGSMIIQQPEIINSLIVNQNAINKMYIRFTQDQEIEADIYAVQTLEKLNLPKNSVKEFLSILEDKTKFDIIDEELKKFSTHPLFKDRYDIVDSNINNNGYKFNEEMQNEFKFIQSKFIAYTNNEYSNDFNEDEAIYYYAIKDAISGKLSESLKKLNSLILKNENNYYFLETKADILLSYGYKKEAIEFYEKILNKHPDNIYIKYNIFINSNFEKKDQKSKKNIFLNNINLLYFYSYNRVLISKYFKLSKLLEYSEWNNFFEILLYKKNEIKKNLIDLDSKTKDTNLKKIIKMYI